MKKWAILVTSLAAAVLVIGAMVLLLNRNSDNGSQPDTNLNQLSNEQNEAEDSYTRAEVAAHDSESDCWTIIDGGVYDITSYISVHPGGKGILRACGVDASTMFNERQTEDGESIGSGTPHSERAGNRLEDLRIGRLADEE